MERTKQSPGVEATSAMKAGPREGGRESPHVYPAWVHSVHEDSTGRLGYAFRTIADFSRRLIHPELESCKALAASVIPVLEKREQEDP